MIYSLICFKINFLFGKIRSKSKSDVKNVDLWEELLKLMNVHKITFIKVKGHADNEFNNRCDQLATSAYLNHKE